MIRATEPPVGENLAKLGSRCKMFHVEPAQPAKRNLAIPKRAWFESFLENKNMFHVEHSDAAGLVFHRRRRVCSTWNTMFALAPHPSLSPIKRYLCKD